MAELFDTLQRMRQSVYISDMKQDPEMVKYILKYIDLRLFTLRELSDASEYFFGEKKTFVNYKQAENFFRKD